MAYIASRWDVEVVRTKFDGELFDSMDLMRHTDVFLGMHEAGWTNTSFLSEVKLRSITSFLFRQAHFVRFYIYYTHIYYTGCWRMASAQAFGTPSNWIALVGSGDRSSWA